LHENAKYLKIKNNFNKRNKVGGLSLSDFILLITKPVTMRVSYWHRIVNGINWGIHKKAPIHSQVVSNKGTQII
jgi:hypothetical protein